MPEKITNLEDLKKWNERFKDIKPTYDQLPIVLEWLLDYFFDEAIPKGIDYTKDVLETFIVFSMICNDYNRVQAIENIEANLLYWNDRASKYMTKQLKEVGIDMVNHYHMFKK